MCMPLAFLLLDDTLGLGSKGNFERKYICLLKMHIEGVVMEIGNRSNLVIYDNC